MTELISFGVIAILLLAVAMFGGSEKPAEELEDEPEPFDAFAGGFPVPPMPGQSVVSVPDIVAGDSDLTELSENGANS